MKHWPFVITFTMLITTWGLVQIFYQDERVPLKKPFAEFPLTIAERWEGKELGIDQKALDILKLTDYMMRVYENEKLSSIPVWLYVGYHQSQRTGATYHSPRLCLPGSGWELVESDQITVPIRNQTPIKINKVLTQKGLDKQIVLYWYHDRGRIIASEYLAKAYMIWDAVTKHRTDGTLVRVSVPVTTTPQAAFQQALAFLDDAWLLLEGHLT